MTLAQSGAEKFSTLLEAFKSDLAPMRHAAATLRGSVELLMGLSWIPGCGSSTNGPADSSPRDLERRAARAESE